MEKLMTYQEALEAMEGNCAFALPEWQGFWFLAGGVIYVYTKEGKLLNTPHIDKYKGREDWQKVEFTPELKAAFIKANRLRVDAMLTMIKLTQPCNRECQIAFSCLQAGFMWLGLVLKDMGAPNPYPHSTDSKNPVIEKHADKANIEETTLMSSFADLDRIGACKELRHEIDITTDILSWFKGVQDSRHLSIAMTELQSGKLWLGQQLNWIRIMTERAEAADKMAEDQLLTDAKAAYHRYGQITNFKNFQGNPMPEFDALPENIQGAWKEAIRPIMRNDGMGKGWSNNPWEAFL